MEAGMVDQAEAWASRWCEAHGKAPAQRDVLDDLVLKVDALACAVVTLAADLGCASAERTVRDAFQF